MLEIDGIGKCVLWSSVKCGFKTENAFKGVLLGFSSAPVLHCSHKNAEKHKRHAMTTSRLATFEFGQLYDVIHLKAYSSSQFV